ncbi:calaxin [Neosynchiropus ocellatus]
MSITKNSMKNLTEGLCRDHFSSTEVQCLVRHFHLLLREPTTPGGSQVGLDCGQFKWFLFKVFGMTDDTIMHEVFRTFDKDTDGIVSVREWIEGLSVCLRGSLDEKIKYCFHVYDLDSDEYISKEEMFHMLKNSLNREPEDDPEDGVRDLVEIATKMMDHDHDGRLSYADFEETVKEENLLLEAFGTCLPDIEKIEAFERQVFVD